MTKEQMRAMFRVGRIKNYLRRVTHRRPRVLAWMVVASLAYEDTDTARVIAEILKRDAAIGTRQI